MSKRLSIVSVIICILAILAGALFEPVESVVYEYENGPRLVTDNFCHKAAMAMEADNSLAEEYNLDYTACGMYSPPLSIHMSQKPLPEILTSNIVTLFAPLSTGVYEVEIQTYDKNGKLEKTKIHLSEKQLNKHIDEIYFPDKSTRIEWKRKLLLRINILNNRKKTR